MHKILKIYNLIDTFFPFCHILFFFHKIIKIFQQIQYSWLAYFSTSLFIIDFLSLCRTLPQIGYRVWTLSVRRTKGTSPPPQCMAKTTVSIATQATSSLATVMGKQRSRSNLEILKQVKQCMKISTSVSTSKSYMYIYIIEGNKVNKTFTPCSCSLRYRSTVLGIIVIIT